MAIWELWHKGTIISTGDKLQAEDWREIHAYIGEELEKENVIQCLFSWSDNPDGWASLDFEALLYTVDKKFIVIDGWADTSGWSCRSDAKIVGKFDTLTEAIQLGLSDRSREHYESAVTENN